MSIVSDKTCARHYKRAAVFYSKHAPERVVHGSNPPKLTDEGEHQVNKAILKLGSPGKMWQKLLEKYEVVNDPNFAHDGYPIDLRARISRILAKHDAAKNTEAHISLQLDLYAGRGEQLLDQTLARYGNVDEDPFQDEITAPAAPPAVVAAAAAAAGSSSTAAAPLVRDYTDAERKRLTHRLTLFYRKYNASKLDGIPRTVADCQTSEAELFSQIFTKYNLDAAAIAAEEQQARAESCYVGQTFTPSSSSSTSTTAAAAAPALPIPLPTGTTAASPTPAAAAAPSNAAVQQLQQQVDTLTARLQTAERQNTDLESENKELVRQLQQVTSLLCIFAEKQGIEVPRKFFGLLSSAKSAGFALSASSDL